jgi:hypothetical protein
MKTFCLLLSLYVFSLSVIPCCSDDNCNDEIISEKVNNHSQEDHKEEGDCNACSPFLDCGTCIGFVFTNLQIDIDEIPSDEGKFIADYKSQFSDDFFGKIWQPPKVS